jgi:dolichol-phosphate mannosyltransferase
LANVRWAKKGILSFSYLPLELISLMALLVAFVALLAIVFQIVDRLLHPELPHGIATVIVTMLFLGSIQLIALAFIAEYLAKIFEETKQRPLFITTRLINFDAKVADEQPTHRTPVSG